MKQLTPFIPSRADSLLFFKEIDIQGWYEVQQDVNYLCVY